MPRTPDARHGELFEEEGIKLSSSLSDPADEGELKYYSGSFKVKDSVGVFNLRGGGGITEDTHKTLRQLIHFIDNGPAEGFTSGAYRETTGTVFPTAIIWYDKAGVGKKKIVEKLMTWTGTNPTTIVWKMYDATETLLVTVTDTISYSGNFETSRTRAIV